MEILYERRKFTRWPFAEPVQIRRVNHQNAHGSLARDIGLGGLSVVVGRFIPLSAKVQIEGEVVRTREYFTGVAKVAWIQKLPYSEDQYCLGLEFVEMTQDSRKAIGEYIGKLGVLISVGLLLGFLMVSPSFAYWEWTPQTGRWINPKYASKATPQEQYEWARGLYEVKDYKKAVSEYAKITKHFPHSDYAPKGQLGLAESYEGMGEYYKAIQAYQKLFDTYPSYAETGTIIERQYRIANLFFEGHKRKILGVEILPSGEQAIEIYKKVVDNAPYGPQGEAAQYKIGECYKKLGKYAEAKEAFESGIRQYPDGEYADTARFQIALCTVKESKKAVYDQQATDQAIAEFKEFIRSHPQSKSVDEAKTMIGELLDRKAEKSFHIANFYQSRGEIASAKVYYQEVITQYPESSYATTAKEKLEKMPHGS
jgi:outer membrane protein assembly factor BamD (BamD/ComL family)